MPRAVTSLGRLSCGNILSSVCPSCYSPTVSDTQLLRAGVFEFCSFLSGSARQGIWSGSGFVFRGYKLKELVCLLYVDGSFKWIQAWRCVCAWGWRRDSEEVQLAD